MIWMSLGRRGSYKRSKDKVCQTSNWYGDPSLLPWPGWSKLKTHSHRLYLYLLTTSFSWSISDLIVWNLSPSVSRKGNVKDSVMSFHSGSRLRLKSYWGDATGPLISSTALWTPTTLALFGGH